MKLIFESNLKIKRESAFIIVNKSKTKQLFLTLDQTRFFFFRKLKELVYSSKL